MALEFDNPYPEDFMSVFSMDTARPMVARAQFGYNNEFLRHEQIGVDDTKDILVTSEGLSYGKYKVDKYYDIDGDLTDWCVTLHPQIDKGSLEYVRETLLTQPTFESRNKLIGVYKKAMPVTEVTPRDGVSMYFPGNSIHLERDRQYIVWSDGSENDLAVDREDQETHYVVGKGVSLKAIDVPGRNGELGELYFDGEIKYLSIGIDAIIKKMHCLIMNNNIRQDYIRLLVNSNLSISQQPSGGTKVRSSIDK